jgi:hypothetical protein
LDEVEIKNVGGRSGVASEVTLQRLLDATTQNSTNASAAAQTRKRLVETSNKAQKDNTSILGKATAGVKGLAKEFVSGGDRVSDFSKHVLGASGKLQNLVEYLDDNVDQFRSLSQVGAGFNNSIFDMMKSAGLSAMRMDEFYRVVQDNSEVLRMLGGSVTQGAKDFGSLSKLMRQGNIGDNLFNLGFTISDVNDGLINYINNQALQGRLEGMSQRQLIAGSQDYLVEIDKLSKATGLSRDALMEQQKQLNNNSKFQALINNASAEGASNLSRNLGVVANLLGPQYADDLALMASGAGGMSELYRGLVASGSAGQELASILENAGNMTQTEFLGALREAGPAVAEEFDNLLPGVQASLERSGTDLAAAFNARGALAQMQNLNDAAQAEQDAQNRVTNFLTSFGNQLQQVKTNVLDKIIKSDFGKAVTSLGTSLGAALTSLFGPNTEGGTAIGGAFGSLSDGIGAAVTKLTGPEGYLTKLTDAIRSEVEAFTAATSPNAANRVSPIDYLRERAGELGTQLKNWFTDMFFGREYQEGPELHREGGIVDTISAGFSSLMTMAKDKFMSIMGLEDSETAGKSIFTQIMEKLFPPNESGEGLGARMGNALVESISKFMESSGGQALIDTIGYHFEGVMLTLQEAIDSKIGILSNDRLARERAAYEEKGMAQGRLSGAGLENAQANLRSRLEEQLSLAERGAAQAYQYQYGDTHDFSPYQDLINQYNNAGGNYQVPQYLQEQGIPVRRVGTLKATGQNTEPKDITAKLHAGERVLNPSETAAVNDLPNAINQLNTLTAQIRDLMTQSVSYQERTARGIRKLGSDIMT